jgi:cell wall-associated NlpC family hydrolase
MSRRHADLLFEPERPRVPGVLVAGWAVLAAVGIVGLAIPGAADSAQPAPSTVRTALAAAESPMSPAIPAPTPVAAAAKAAPAAGAQPAANPAANRTLAALKIALAQVGLPYVWGGNGPTNGDAGFDCSGLTHFAYATAGVALPRTAHTQFYAGPHVPAGQALEPGDLVFYGTPSFVHHVGMYLGGGRMVNAPTFGEPVQVAYYRWPGDDYVGATRPDGSSVDGLFQLPFIPEAYGPVPSVTTPRISGTFVAPRATVPAPLPLLTATAPVPEAQSAAAAITEQRQLGVVAPQAAPTAAKSVDAAGGTATVVGSTILPVLPAPATIVAASPTTDPAAVPPSALPTVVASPSAAPIQPTTVPPAPAATSAVAIPPTTTDAPPAVVAPTTTAAPAPRVAPSPPPRAAVVQRAAPVRAAAPAVPAAPPKKKPAVPKSPVVAAVPKSPVVAAVPKKVTVTQKPAAAAVTTAESSAPEPTPTPKPKPTPEPDS